MRAVVRRRYGGPEVLQLEEIEKPRPGDGQVLVRVYAASLNKSDWYLLRGKPFLARLIVGGLLRPKRRILGTDLAGRVEAVGTEVTRFRPGDDVFGFGRGTLAEYVCTAEDRLAPKPVDLAFEDAAAMPVAASTALQACRTGRVKAGERVLVDGASGGVGTFSVMVAKSYGAEVTAVCGTGNINNARSLGASKVIDYTKDDFTRCGQRWDVILLVNGHHSILGYRRALNRMGTCIMVGSSRLSVLLQFALFGRLLSRLGSRNFELARAKLDRDDLTALVEVIRAGKVTPFIDRRYLLEETAAALRYLGEGHAKGKIVIKMTSE